MARLINCWFIIESVVIPDGFLKWFYLSFYIHPLLLLFCQIFLWLKPLKIWTLRLFLLFVRKPIVFVVGCILQLLRYFGVPYTANVETETSNSPQNQVFSGSGSGSYSSLRFEFTRYEEPKIYQLAHDDPPMWSTREIPALTTATARLDNEERKDSNSDADQEGANRVSGSFDEYPSSESLCSTLSSRGTDLLDKPEDHYCPFVEFLQFPSAVEEERDDASIEVIPSDDDPFYSLYLQRMKWFDLLGYERTCGITAILKSELGFRNTFEGMNISKSSPHQPLSKLSKKRILKSIENDMEMVYVAQTCLTWEALHHQYVKVQDLKSSSSSTTSAFISHDVADAFQNFQILLDRFMENDRSSEQGTRYSNYFHSRGSQKSLLQVPQVTADVLGENERQDKKGEDMETRKVLKVIENCIKAFWVFVKTDNKRFWYKFKTSRSTYAMVDDPRDLPLLADLTNCLHEHELRMKDLQGKKRCWLKMRRVASHTGDEAQERREILFTLIDLGLVKRALRMSVISSSQLRWCQQKLGSIRYQDGKVSRTIHNNCLLFPPS